MLVSGGGRGGGDLGRELEAAAAAPLAVLLGRAEPGGERIEPKV